MKTANIVISCPDQKGIVHAVTWFLFNQNANIVSLEQHIEDWTFFMRVEWDLTDFPLSKIDFIENFTPIWEKFDMDVKADFKEARKRLWLFCSKDAHCLWDILIKYEMNELDVDIPYVISNHESCRSLVTKFNIPFFHIPTSPNYEDQMLEIITNNKTDVIALARYMKILSERFVNNVNQKIINVHHSFLPSFIWADPYEQAYRRGVKLIGATSHYVIPELDQGPIIHQITRRISHAHSATNLKLIWRESEKEVFALAIKKHIDNKIIVYKGRTIIFE